MNSDLDKMLCHKYPKIFRDRNKPMTQTAMCWGFDCGEGWFNIINATCSLIQSHIDHSRKSRYNALRHNRALSRAIKGDMKGIQRYYSFNGVLDSWGIKQIEKDLLDPKLRNVPDVCPQVIAVQVKEKFGTLRFYVNGGDRYTDGVINMAEVMSAYTCEECGSPGKSRTGGWIRTLCDKHAVEMGYIDGENDEK